MKKRGFIFIILILVSMVSGCGKDASSTTSSDELIACVNNELKSYFSNNETNTIELSDLYNEIPEEIEYFEGKYMDDDNIYIVFSASTWNNIINVIDRYFHSKYSEFYEYEIGSKGIYVYAHSSFGNIDFEDIEDKCIKREKDIIVKVIPSTILDNLKDTNKIIIKRFDEEIGTVKSMDSIKKVLDALSDSYTSISFNAAYLCDGPGFSFEMYNGNKLLDTISVYGDGRRVSPNSINNGCAYFSIMNNDLNLTNVIEDETDYIFYRIGTFNNRDKEDLDFERKLIFEDDKYNYYRSIGKDEILTITFNRTRKKMTLDYAINNGYITPKELYKSDLFVREEK